MIFATLTVHVIFKHRMGWRLAGSAFVIGDLQVGVPFPGADHSSPRAEIFAIVAILHATAGCIKIGSDCKHAVPPGPSMGIATWTFGRVRTLEAALRALGDRRILGPMSTPLPPGSPDWATAPVYTTIRYSITQNHAIQ